MSEGTTLKVLIGLAAALWAIALTGAGLAQPLRSEPPSAYEEVAPPDVAARR